MQGGAIDFPAAAFTTREGNPHDDDEWELFDSKIPFFAAPITFATRDKVESEKRENIDEFLSSPSFWHLVSRERKDSRLLAKKNKANKHILPGGHVSACVWTCVCLETMTRVTLYISSSFFLYIYSLANFYPTRKSLARLYILSLIFLLLILRNPIFMRR